MMLFPFFFIENVGFLYRHSGRYLLPGFHHHLRLIWHTDAHL